MATPTHSLRMTMALERGPVRSPVALLAAAIVGIAVDDARAGQLVSIDAAVLEWGEIDPGLLTAAGVEVVAGGR